MQLVTRQGQVSCVVWTDEASQQQDTWSEELHDKENNFCVFLGIDKLGMHDVGSFSADARTDNSLLLVANTDN